MSESASLMCYPPALLPSPTDAGGARDMSRGREPEEAAGRGRCRSPPSSTAATGLTQSCPYRTETSIGYHLRRCMYQRKPGTAGSPDVNAADEEVVWVDAPWATSSLRQQGITLIIKELFGHVFTCKKVEWMVTNTGAPSSAGVREQQLEFAAGTSSAKLSQ